MQAFNADKFDCFFSKNVQGILKAAIKSTLNMKKLGDNANILEASFFLQLEKQHLKMFWKELKLDLQDGSPSCSLKQEKLL